MFYGRPRYRYITTCTRACVLVFVRLGLANRLNNSDVYTRSFWTMTLQKYLPWCFTYFVEVVIREEARDGDWLARPTLEDCE